MREESKGKGEGINEAIENKGSFQVQLSLQDGARRKMQVVSQQMARIQSYHQRRVYVVEGKYGQGAVGEQRRFSPSVVFHNNAGSIRKSSSYAGASLATR